MLEATARKPGRPFGSKSKAIERQVAEHFQDIEHLFITAPKHHGDLIEQHRKPMGVTLEPFSSVEEFESAHACSQRVWVNTGNCIQPMTKKDFAASLSLGERWIIAPAAQLLRMPCIRA